MRRQAKVRHSGYVVAFIAIWTFPVLHQWLDPDDTIAVLTSLNALLITSQVWRVGQALAFGGVGCCGCGVSRLATL